MSAPVPSQTETQPGLGTVLVAVGPNDHDRLDRLVEETVDLARPSDATVALTHVFTDEEFEACVDALDFDRESRDVAPGDVAARHSVVRKFGRRLRAAGVDYEVHGAVGAHGEGVSLLAADLSADLVVVGGRRRSPTGKALFGSIAQEVMLSAPCPVTFVRADTE